MRSTRGFGAAWLLPVTVAVVLGACGSPVVTSSPSSSPVAAASPSATAAGPTAETTPVLTPSPSPIPTPTTAPNPTPSDSLFLPEFQFVNQFVMKVAVSGLNVRRKPSTSAISNGKAPKDGLFMMFDWPVQAGGYTWYWGFTLITSKPGVIPDLPAPINVGYDEVLSGWMATGTEDAPLLVPLAPRCPTTVDLANVAGMLASERISCFGSTSIQLEGRYGGEGCGGVAPGTFEPDWLAYPIECARLGPKVDAEDAVPLYLHFPPDHATLPADRAVIRLRGHFSDARSTTCRITVLGEDGASSVKIANGAAEQWCRGKFVVESYEVIG